MQTRNVSITWRNKPDNEFSTLVAVAPGWSYFNKLDDAIFYYFESEKEYRDTLINGTDEFTMKEEN